MNEVNLKGVEELGAMLRERGVPYLTGRLIATKTYRHTQKMIDWLKENPEATGLEMEMKAVELGHL